VNDAFQIATVFGIPIRIHWTFPLVLLAVAPTSIGIGGALILFGCVLLHELGHSLVARRFGIRVVDITFWPLGGMARMSEIPEQPGAEALIAIAGPAVNFALTLLGAALAFLLPVPGAARLFGSFAVINVLMGTFNLLPAFPMDGGRILRAWFGRRMDWVAATERAVRVGRAIAIGLLVVSVWLAFRFQSFCALPFIAIFIWFVGARELMAVRVRHGLPPFGVGALGGLGGLGNLGGFGRRGPAAAERAARAEWRTATETGSNASWSASVEPGVAQRPVAWQPVRPEHGGFDEEAIRALESFRGRLRGPSQDD